MNNNQKPVKDSKNAAKIEHIFTGLTREILKIGFSTRELKNSSFSNSQKQSYFQNICTKILKNHVIISILAILLISVSYELNFFHTIFNYLLGVRCLIPNNYFIWEATRPVSDCQFCTNLTEAIILRNLSREEFAPLSYSSKPIVIKGAFLHWPAMKYFDFKFFKELYASISESYKSVDEECQFLHFKSNFISIKDVFEMTQERVDNAPGEKSWYVGWGNCHPQILEEMRRYYPKPHFLPEDCEMPPKDYIFMGYDDGATMHLDFINRLMWQAQLKGSKTWHLIPPPECEDSCTKLSFLVEPGDAVLVDTRVWYHGTTITSGEFSLSVQSEYG